MFLPLTIFLCCFIIDLSDISAVIVTFYFRVCIQVLIYLYFWMMGVGLRAIGVSVVTVSILHEIQKVLYLPAMLLFSFSYLDPPGDFHHPYPFPERNANNLFNHRENRKRGVVFLDAAHK